MSRFTRKSNLRVQGNLVTTHHVSAVRTAHGKRVENKSDSVANFCLDLFGGHI